MNPNYFTKTLLPLYTALQPKFRKVMGPILYSDETYEHMGDFRHGEYHDIRTLVIPRTIDDSSPEAQKRSLWGMVDWKRWSQSSDGSGLIRMGSERYKIFIEGTPTEAILKALVAQWEVEV